MPTTSPAEALTTTASFRNFSGTGAENYERYFVPAIGEPASTGLLLGADLQAGERVLDVACGTGVIARLAAEQVGPAGSVTGLDISPDMIDVAASVPAPAEPRIDWHVGDATTLPFPDNSYDVVLCQMGLMFIENRLGALREMQRVLAARGRVVVSTPGPIQPIFELMEKAIIEHISPELGGFVRAVFSMHDPSAVAGLLEEAGLSDVAAEVTNAELRLPAPAEFLWQYINLTPMGPFVAKAPEAAKLAMEHQVVDAWQSFVVDGRTLLDQPMVIASGRT